MTRDVRVEKISRFLLKRRTRIASADGERRRKSREKMKAGEKARRGGDEGRKIGVLARASKVGGSVTG